MVVLVLYNSRNFVVNEKNYQYGNTVGIVGSNEYRWFGNSANFLYLIKRIVGLATL